MSDEKKLVAATREAISELESRSQGHDVRVKFVQASDQWRMALDGFELKGVVDVKIEQSVDTPIRVSLTIDVQSVKGFTE